MFKEKVKQLLNAATDNSTQLDIVTNETNVILTKVCKYVYFIKEIDENTVEAAINSGYGHDIVLLFTNENDETHVSVNCIEFFGDKLNIVNLRRHGFIDDSNMLVSEHYDGSSHEFYKTHAKKYMTAIIENDMKCIMTSIARIIKQGINKLQKNGLSSNALFKMQQYAQTRIDNNTYYTLLKANDKTSVQTVIKSIIGESNKIFQTSSIGRMRDELYFDRYSGMTYSKLIVVDSLVCKTDDIYNCSAYFHDGVSFRYEVYLNSSTLEMTTFDDAQYDMHATRASISTNSNRNMAAAWCMTYDVMKQIKTMCQLSNDITFISYTQVGEVVKAYTKIAEYVIKVNTYAVNVADIV